MPARLTRGAALAALLGLAAPAACTLDVHGESATQAAAALTGGDPARGAAAIRRYGCESCHAIDGIRGTDALVGPPLGPRLSQQLYIAGVLPNTPDALVRWVMDPRDVDPKTAMPDLGVTEDDARDIAAYLYSRR
jgi:cytochrome c2